MKVEYCPHVDKDNICTGGLKQVVAVPIEGYKRKKKKVIMCHPCAKERGYWNAN